LSIICCVRDEFLNGFWFGVLGNAGQEPVESGARDPDVMRRRPNPLTAASHLTIDSDHDFIEIVVVHLGTLKTIQYSKWIVNTTGSGDVSL
jgi:hypothetical protein